ncbi:helix-turn-helix transcriptional regulator [Natronorarus salvus]|uniref:helix-turn-helix transcriptional regulator n=1 Tax=Natronorarus salvus TaxID=3117733 RepID=UPI002F268E42
MFEQFFRDSSPGGLWRRLTSFVPGGREELDEEPDDAAETSVDRVDGAGAVDGPEEELGDLLTTNEGEVLEVLSEHGGVMRQGRIVEETGWSASKVSYTLTSLAEGGRIEKLRIGRENVIRHDGVDHPIFDAYTDTARAREPGR